MAKKAFVSFDYDHDADLKTMLVGKAKNTDSPLEIADYSVKEPFFSAKGNATKQLEFASGMSTMTL